MVAVTFALPYESAGFLNRLSARSSETVADIDFQRGEIRQARLIVLHTGVGEPICRKRLETLFQIAKVDYLISAGFAGALDPDLKVGDLVIAENYSSPELLRGRGLQFGTLDVYTANLATTATVVETAEERDELARRTGAAAVDMETESIAAACAQRKVPLLALRAISDTLAEPLPAPATVLFDTKRQKTPALRLGWHILTHPGAIRALKQFERRTATARQRLSDALVSILEANLV